VSFLIFILGGLFGALVTSAIGYMILKNNRPGESVEYVDLIPADRVTVTVYVVENSNTNYPMGRWFDLPIPWEHMVKVSRKVVGNDYSFGYSLTGKEAGNPLSRAEFESLRSLFLEKGLICYRVPTAHRSGLQLTVAGKAYFKQWAAYPTHPDITLGEWEVRESQTRTNTITNPFQTQKGANANLKLHNQDFAPSDGRGNTS